MPPVDDDHPGWVCFSAQDWWMHNQAHSDFQLMRRVARTRRVLLVNSIGMRMPRRGTSTTPLRRIARKAASVARAVRRPAPEAPGFHVMTPVIVPMYGSARGRTLNATLVRWQVQAVSRALGIRNPVCMVTIPTAWDVIRPMRVRRLVVNRSDKHSAFREADTAVIADLERQLLAAADEALYVSRSLMEEEADLTENAATFLDHGVDLDRFRADAGPEPAALAAVRRPRIGYVGGMNSYQIDADLFAAVADGLPDCDLVLVGATDLDLTDLCARPNVHWLGQRPYDEIPAIMASLDVGLMPWQANEWITHANPIKIKEYLAVGLPVVSTPYPELVRYADIVRVASDADDFVAHVRSALEDDDPTGADRRRAAVLPDSWDRRADEVLRAGEPDHGLAPAPVASPPPVLTMVGAARS